ncbi:MAG: sugar transferase [Bacteroidota bacterium]|nr:sugar transferase [Odoribacter sp.]MDP3642500.1 sugar transferase [Bacteroidota bacterium]
METNNQVMLKIIHIGADPEFNSPIKFENYTVEINTTDNPFSVAQWVTANGLPDGVICEKNISGDDAFNFFDFWIEQFDNGKKIPFIILDDEKNQETVEKALQLKIDDVYTKPVSAETMISRILILKKIKPLTHNDSISQFTPQFYHTPFFKRTFDLLFALLGLLLISPLLLLIGIAIKIESRGKVHSISKRVGTGYWVFDLYNLRSRYSNPDKRFQELSHLNQYLKEAHPAYSEKDVENDPRLTKMGYIIHKTGIDKWLQLINVIKGDLSLVGNRPILLYEAEMLTVGDWNDRFQGPAGLTGLWKIKSHRSYKSLSSEDRKRLDNKYADIAKRKYPFWKDLLIILRTIPAIVQKKNV